MPTSYEDLKAEALALVDQYGSIAEAARVAEIARKTLSDRVAAARRDALRGVVGGPPIPDAAKPPEGFVISRNSGAYDADGKLLRQWVGSKPDAGEVYEAPAGHTIKGESALLTADGRVLQRWVKTRAEDGSDGLLDGFRAAFAEYEGRSPSIAAPSISDDDLLTVYPLPDLHLGMLSWGKETGESYDVKIAMDTALRSLETLVAQSRPSRHAVLLGLGDYLHMDDQRNVTPGSGHQLDADGRWAKIFAAGAKLATKMVELLAIKHHSVEVRWLSGNHDVNSAMCLTVALDLFYSNNPRVTVNTDPGIAYYRRFGECLIGATHGHTVKMARLPMMMASDRAVDWGQTKHRSFFTGHIHTETVQENGGVRVESLQAPAARDAWNAASGYRSGRSMSAITFHTSEGEIGRHRVNIVSPVAKAA